MKNLRPNNEGFFMPFTHCVQLLKDRSSAKPSFLFDIPINLILDDFQQNVGKKLQKDKEAATYVFLKWHKFILESTHP